jgi:hypothetical protein
MGMGKRTITAVAAIAAGLILAAPASAGILLSPSSWNFGTLAIGSTSAPKTFTLTVTCVPSDDGTIPCQFPQYLNPVISTTGDFAVPSEDCPSMMAAGPPGFGLPYSQSCTINATFGPTAGGTRPGSLQTGGPTAMLTGFAPLPPAPAGPTPTTAAPKKKCKKHRSASAAKKRCKKRR